MRLNAPKVITFWIAVIIAVLGILGALATIPVLTDASFWLVVFAFVILLLGNVLEGV